MIQIESLTKQYGSIRALDGLSLQVEAGVVYGFLGPNGAGKTTTMRILCGLAKATSGRAIIHDQVIGEPGTDIRPLIGVLPEEPAFYPWMSAREYLRDLIAALHKLPAHIARLRADELLERVDLAKARDRRIRGFSRGMRQRLGLAAALIHHPPILLLDEPVSALDPAGRKDVLDLIESLRGRTTILLSTHILADVERVCDVVGIIDKGRLIAQDRRDDLLARYAQPVFEIEADGNLEQWLSQVHPLPFIESVQVANHTVRLLVNDIHQAQIELLDLLSRSQVLVRRFQIIQPSLEDVFLRLTGKEN